MQESEPLMPEEGNFADALGALAPLRPELNVQQIWIEAQRRRWRTQVFVWRGVAAVLALGLVASILLRPHGTPGSMGLVSVKPIEQVNQTSREERPAEGPGQPLPVLLTGNDYLALRSRVVAFGMEALPAEAPSKGTYSPAQPLDASIRPPQPHENINLLGPLWKGSHS